MNCKSQVLFNVVNDGNDNETDHNIDYPVSSIQSFNNNANTICMPSEKWFILYDKRKDIWDWFGEKEKSIILGYTDHPLDPFHSRLSSA
jgi:hypothetical protein